MTGRIAGATGPAPQGAEPISVVSGKAASPLRGAWYNENDPFAAAWLRELIKDGRIAPGEVDERSIEDVRPSDLAGFVQCHFFAGIGIWSLALREAGWPDDRPIWTGSCPCQPFSAAGKGGGFADERHLWPAFHWLIEQCGPELVLGEQVASKDGLAWLDLVSADLEASGYAFGAADTCAAGFGAPHIRQRLYWMADASGSGRQPQSLERPASLRNLASEPGERGDEPRIGGPSVHGMANADDTRLEGRIAERECAGERAPRPGSVGGGVADARGERRAGKSVFLQRRRQDEALPETAGRGSTAGARPGPLNGLWRAADWLCCTDGKWRPVAPGTFPLAPTGTVRNRVGLLRGAGNAINLAQARGFIEAVIEAIADSRRMAETTGSVRSTTSGGAESNRTSSSHREAA